MGFLSFYPVLPLLSLLELIQYWISIAWCPVTVSSVCNTQSSQSSLRANTSAASCRMLRLTSDLFVKGFGAATLCNIHACLGSQLKLTVYVFVHVCALSVAFAVNQLNWFYGVGQSLSLCPSVILCLHDLQLSYTLSQPGGKADSEFELLGKMWKCTSVTASCHSQLVRYQHFVTTRHIQTKYPLASC